MDENPGNTPHLSTTNNTSPITKPQAEQYSNGVAMTSKNLHLDETFYKQVLESLEDYAVFTINREALVSSWNKGAENLLGYSESEIIGKSATLFYTSEDQQQGALLKEMQEALALGRATDERYHVRKNGSHFWVSGLVFPLKDKQDNLIGFTKVMRDITRIQQTQQAIQLTEERFQLIAKATNDVIWDWNLLTDQIWWNVGFKTLYGYSEEQIEPGIESWYNRIHPEDRDRVVNGIHQVIDNGGKQWMDEYRFLKADGNYAYIMDRGYALHTEEGIPYRMLGSMMDITEQKKVETTLKDSNRRFQSLADTVPNMVWVAEPDGFVSYYNLQWYQYTGINFSASQGWGWENVIHPDDLPELLRKWKYSLENGTYYSAEARHRNKAGDYRWFLIRALPYKDSQGKIQNWFGTCTDINDTKANEQSLLESERYFRAMADSVPVIIWVCNPEGLCTYLNKQWFDFTGQSNSKGLGLEWASAVHPDDLEMAKTVFLEANKARKPFSLMYRLREKNGTYRWFIDAATPKFDEKGNYEGLVGAVIDIHERKLAEDAQQQLTHKLASANKDLQAYNLRIHNSNAELLAANEALNRLNADLDNFVFTVSHDLKAPLANMEGLLALFMRNMSKQLPDTDKEIFDMLSVSFNRFKNTIEGLIEVINAQQHLHTTVNPISISEVVAETRHDIKAMLEQSNALIQEEYQEEYIPFAWVNLQSIVFNLLSNALKYRSPARSPIISIRTYRHNSFIVLEVKDNGLGMTEQEVAKLFNMFKRFHTHIEGTGVGLYIIKRLIENNGGEIMVESQPGQGSVFKVLFKDA